MTTTLSSSTGTLETSACAAASPRLFTTSLSIDSERSDAAGVVNGSALTRASDWMGESEEAKTSEGSDACGA
jgi:hypothetical protein